LLRNVKCIEPNFITTGFSNWKKATGRDGRLASHQASTCHAIATQSLNAMQNEIPVATLLSQQLSDEQHTARNCLRVLFTSVGYLARQGLALRGHDDDEGNFMQLLRLRSLDVPEFESWLNRKKAFTHHAIQDEILQLYGDATLRLILAKVQTSQSFAIIVDGTQDINRTEQESMCLRFVDDDLNPCEEFVGFYSVDGTTGKMLASCVKDCMLRYQLPLAKLRGQTYDGAANMSGAYNGCQALISREQPLAAYVHCSAHCTNLAACAVCSSSVMVRDSVQSVNDFGVLCSASGNLKSLFAKIAISDADCQPTGPVRNIKPLCPTRWLVRVRAISATLDQYALILQTLEEAKSTCSTEVSARASGLLTKFQDPTTLLGLNTAQVVLSALESLNRSLQSARMTVAGMLEAARTVKSQLQEMRQDGKFNELLVKVERQVKELDLEHLSVPRARQPPARFCGLAEAFHAKSVEVHYRIEYFKLLDVAIQQLDDRLLDCPGLARYCELEAILVSGQINEKVACLYPELASDGRSFQTQMDMFHSLPEIMRSPTSPNLEVCTSVLRNMTQAMRAMFPHVESLVRLLLVNPASSATAERSFSSLRRLKTYLRSTCGQQRLNGIALCHVHKDIIDNINVDEIMKEFILSRDNRAAIFGHIATKAN